MQSKFGNVFIYYCPLALKNNSSVPLKDITVKANICNFFADVFCKYAYENQSDDLLESSFVFPIEYGATVYKFEVEVGIEKFVSTCRERHEVCPVFSKFQFM